MKKEYDYDEEIEELDADELNREQMERAKILVKVIPFVLIIFILAISLLVSAVKNKNDKKDNQALQESIKEYADSNFPDGGEDSEGEKEALAVATPTPEKTEEPLSPSATMAPLEEDAKEEPTPYKEIMQAKEKDYSKIEFEAEEQLSEMMRYWAENNQEALKDLVNLDWYKAMSYSLRGTTNFYYYGDKDANGRPNGTGIAVYADNQYYYGSWQNGQRSGRGSWFHFHIHDTENTTDIYEYHQYAGMWSADLPEGEGSEHYEIKTELLKPNVGYNNNLIGTYHKGLVNGEFYMTNIYSDEEVMEWTALAKNGSWVYLSENRDSVGRGPVHVDVKDANNYVWLHPNKNKNIGVSCLISSQKN